MTGILTKGTQRNWTQKLTGKMRDRTDASSIWGMTNTASKQPETGKRKARIISLQVSEGTCPINTLTLDFLLFTL